MPPKTAQDQIAEQQAQDALQDQQETQQATEEAVDEVSGPDKKPGDKGFRTIEDSPELLAQIQDPHAGSQKAPTMIWAMNAYQQPVLMPV